ncbi:MAG TPA: GDSL-type esterase/lipase family protein [Opitutales bacterium]|nr:GDSL-type esterase/lipase family protein [Opitutales bacterium]
MRETLRLLPLGDSITAGYTDNPKWDHPFKFGYRSGLYSRLSNVGYNFRFVGGSTEPWTGISGDPTRGGSYTPAFDLRELGQDGHRGYGGKTAAFLNKNILAYLAEDDPDLVLLMIGTNKQDRKGLDKLVNTITSTKPEANMILAQIIPKTTYQQSIVDYNSYLRDTLVPRYQALGRNITLVDLYSLFLAEPGDLTSIDSSLFSNGINHPTNQAYDAMAEAWFDAIKTIR